MESMAITFPTSVAQIAMEPMMLSFGMLKAIDIMLRLKWGEELK
jgi:hypothetical protein